MSAPRIKLKNLPNRIESAIDHFWIARSSQSNRQGSASGRRDAGRRADVTGGKQLDGFADLLSTILTENGVPPESIHQSKRVEIPGYFRPTKKWDLVVVANEKLIACIEFKAQAGPSFGNNYNNRAEEAIGSSVDVKTAFREGAFKTSPSPWLGYLMLVEEVKASSSPVKVHEPHFPVLSEFRNISYVERYEETLMRLQREELYNSACLLLSTPVESRYTWREPCVELSFKRMATSLVAHAIGVLAAD